MNMLLKFMLEKTDEEQIFFFFFKPTSSSSPMVCIVGMLTCLMSRPQCDPAVSVPP